MSEPTISLLPQEYEVVPIEELREHPRNPRKGRTDVIKASMEKHGAYGVVLVQKSTGFILAGKHRIETARQGGLTKYPVVKIDVDDREALRILLDDNHASDVASYYEEIRLDVLDSILEEEGGLDGTTYTVDEYEQIAQGEGRFVDDATGFLGDDLDDDGDDGIEEGDADAPGYFTVSFTVDPEQRRIIREALAAKKGGSSAGMTSPEAMVEICNDWTREFG
jgi:hypothetical protein